MKRRLEVLVGVLLASALMLGGCVAQTDDEEDTADEAVGQAQAQLVGGPETTDPTRSTSGTDPSNSGSVVKPGVPGMVDPQPQPYKPPPSPGGGPADPGTSNQH
jgi:hypothetical protein